MTCTQKPNYQIDTPHTYTCCTVGSLVMLFPPLCVFFAYFAVSFTCNCDRFVETNNWIRGRASSDREKPTVNEMELMRKKSKLKQSPLQANDEPRVRRMCFFSSHSPIFVFCRCCRCHATSEHFSCDCNVIRNLLLDMSQWVWIERVCSAVRREFCATVAFTK